MANLSSLQSLMAVAMRSNAPDFLSNRVVWINEAQRKICLLEPWDFTAVEISPSISASPYTLTWKVAMIGSGGVWRTSGANSPLELMPIDIGSVSLLASTGAPTHYRVGGEATPDQLYLYPVPDIAYTHRIAAHKFLPDFVNPSDENSLSIISPYVLVFGAMIEAAIHLGRDPGLWKARFQEELAILITNHSSRQRSGG